MENKVCMPTMGITMTSGKIIKWKKAIGDQVALAEELYEIETEKTSMTIESPFAGMLKEIVVQEGEEADCGALIAVIEG